MDLLTALLGITTVGGCLFGIAVHVFGREANHVAGMFRAEDLGWPPGIQEEDPPPMWHAAPLTARPALDPEPAFDPEPAIRLPARVAVRPAAPRRVGGR